MESSNWAAVLPGEAITTDERGLYLAMTRRDDAIGIRRESTPALAGSWVEDQRPSLDHARRLFIPTTPGSIIYFGERRNSWWR